MFLVRVRKLMTNNKISIEMMGCLCHLWVYNRHIMKKRLGAQVWSAPEILCPLV